MVDEKRTAGRPRNSHKGQIKNDERVKTKRKGEQSNRMKNRSRRPTYGLI